MRRPCRPLLIRLSGDVWKKSGAALSIRRGSRLRVARDRIGQFAKRAAGPRKASCAKREMAVACGGTLRRLGAVCRRLHSARLHIAARASRFQNMTFRQGLVSIARFTSDGGNIVYSASWDGGPIRAYLATAGTPEARDLGLPDGCILMSVSARDEIAYVSGPFAPNGAGTLAVPRSPADKCALARERYYGRLVPGRVHHGGAAVC